uniref:Uncharacterized protein n=1 Tax=Triticum urartu TaxID=4572 RepID=A0A8R7TVH7_TRIUA
MPLEVGGGLGNGDGERGILLLARQTMDSAGKIWSFARCGNGHLINDQLEALRTKSTENIPLPLHLKLNLQVVDSRSSSVYQIEYKGD